MPGQLTSLEIAAGMVLPARRREADRHAGPGRSDAGHGFDREQPSSPREALERAILPGLLRPPCLVSFSGGRDSAAVLAVATAVARREGLPVPIPATNVFPSVVDADESSWQELVVRELGLSDWLRMEHADELDLIGPYAQRVLTTHGVLWPANVHFHLPLLEAVAGGSMLTGLGGDELYVAARRQHASAVLAGAVRPRPRDVLSVGLALAPRVVRKSVIARRAGTPVPWLRPEARKRVTGLLAAEGAAEPRRLGERLAWWQRVRYLQVAARSLDVLARDTQTLLIHPLLSPQFWSAVETAAMPIGFATRSEGVRRLFGDLLPPALIERTTKANFDAIFWTKRARAFAGAWDGSGVSSSWVDTRELARHWAGSKPSLPSSSLLQAAWLASAGHRGEQPLEAALH
jgi:hypothetical protein